MRLRRLRKRTQLLLFAGALLLPTALLTGLSAKLLLSLSDLGQSIRKEYGDYVVGIAVREVENSLLDREQINMVAARFQRLQTAKDIDSFLSNFQRQDPLYLMAFFVVPEGLVHYSRLDLERTAPYRPLPPWIHSGIMATLSRASGVPSGLRHISSPDLLNPVQVTYFTLEGEDGRTLGAAGFVWDLEYLKQDSRFLERTLIHGVQTEQNLFQGEFFESPPVLSFLDEAGKPVFRTEALETDTYLAVQPLSRILPFYRIGVSLEEDRFSAWLKNVLWLGSALIAAMVLMTLLTILFSSRFVMHELELAEWKSTLVSNVSHELKTPLSLIRLYSETLELDRAGSPEKRREFLRIIGREAERLTHLINNVLDVGRIELGKKTYNLVPMDLSELVKQTLSNYDHSLTEQGFTLDQEVQTGLPPILGDAAALTQALLNLLDNAVKYSLDTKYLKVRLFRDQDRVVVSVADRGMGIAPIDQQRIFETFYRVEKGLRHNVKGSGLGLSLVQHIVQGHHGEVRLESQTGQGSTFSILLPLLSDTEAASLAAEAEERHA